MTQSMSILGEISSLRNQVLTMNKDLGTNKSTIKSTTEEECKVLEAKIEKEKRENDEKMRLLEERKKKLLDEYNKQKYETKKCEEIGTNELKELELKRINLEIRQAKISKLFDELKKAEQVDICFMVDCTGSMQPYINEAKTVVHRVVDKLSNRFKDLMLRCAFVGYRDHCDGGDRVTVLPFTENKETFKAWVSNLKAIGGGDECEDVFGGLEQVNSLGWANMTRVLFHIGDAPCHGTRFHMGAGDIYPSGDPRGLNITKLLSDISKKNIDYYFAEITNTTLKMIDEFNKELKAHGREVIRMKLTSADELFECVSRSLTSSIMNSKSLSMHDGHGKPLKNYTVDTAPINWSDMSKFQKFEADLFVPSFSCDLKKIKDKSVEYKQRKVELLLAKRPFAKGGLRYAFAALINMGTKKDPQYIESVMKESIFLTPEYNEAKYYKEMIEVQVVAKHLAENFMKTTKGEKLLRFLDVSLIHVNKTGIYFSSEPFVDGKFTKWTNNAGVVNEEDYACTLNAFSHWTYQATNEYLVVTDLQGFRVGDVYLLTDPAITCVEDPFRFSSTNLGIKGLAKFFQSHQCNNVCKNLKLIKHKYQELDSIKLDTFKFSV